MKFLYTTKYPLVENVLPTSSVKPLDEIEELENSLETNLNQEVKIPKDVIDSFKIKDSLNPQIWPDGQLDPQVQKKLLRIANGFIKDIKLPKGSKIKDIIFTGSLANFNWSKFSDIDLHVVLNFNQFDGDPKMIEGFFESQRKLWEKEHDIKIFDYPVQAYAQDSNQELVATAVYSILKDKWVKKPKRETFNLDKNTIKAKAQTFINTLKDIRDDYKNHQFQSVIDKVTKVKDKIKQMRKAGLESGGEFSLENLVFKTLRRTPFMDILDSFKAKAYDAVMSVEENMVDEGEMLDNTRFVEKREDEDTFSISAMYKGNEIGHIVMDVMTDAYWYFADEMSEEEYNDLFVDDAFVRIGDVKIQKGARGEKIGKELMKRGLNKIKRMGYDTVYLNASPTDSDGLPLNDLVNFYKSFGFKPFLNQGNNVQMILDFDGGLMEVIQLPYNDKEEMKGTFTPSTSSSKNFNLSDIKFRMAKASKIAATNPNYFTQAEDGDGFYQVEFRNDGNIRTKHVRSSGDMQQLGGAFQPSDVGTCKTFQNIARYCFVKAGKNGKSVGPSPADDAANKALVIFKDEILDFLGGGGSYTDDTAAKHSQQSMDDKMKMHKQKKDLEMKLKRRVTDMEFQNFLATGEEPKPKTGISMDPDKLSDFEKRQEILRAKIAARQNRGK
jgi:predicted GNAT family N-acyltransferase